MKKACKVIAMIKIDIFQLGRRTVVLAITLAMIASVCYSTRADVFVSLTTDNNEYCLYDQVEITITATNTGDQPATFTFPTNQQADLEIRDDNHFYYRWSDGRFFLMIITSVTIEPDSTVELLSFAWKPRIQTDQNNCPLQPGTYYLQGWMVEGLGHWEIHAPEVQISFIECLIEGESGDVNEDGAVNVLDVIRAVNFILNGCCQTTAPPRCWAADCNGDDEINVLDVIGIVEMILGTGSCVSTYEGWTTPTTDALILTIRLSEDIWIDSTLAGEIQYNLDLARKVTDEIQNIRAWAPYTLYELLLSSDAWWTAAWPESLYTGYEPIDELLSTYNAVNVSYSGDYFTLEFVQPLNMDSLASLFETVEGVANACPIILIGEGSDITAQPIPDGWSFVFELGWGDCLAGCIYHHYWEVHVIDGIAQLIREWGDPLPSPQ